MPNSSLSPRHSDSNFKLDLSLQLIDFDTSIADATIDQLDAEIQKVMVWLGFDENIWVMFSKEIGETQQARRQRQISSYGGRGVILGARAPEG